MMFFASRSADYARGEYEGKMEVALCGEGNKAMGGLALRPRDELERVSLIWRMRRMRNGGGVSERGHLKSG